ncbi:MAG TPA: hypothetical protein VD887_08040 [Allosphingosinicella sp.]|nr:hypothetical protein [Allosphingosinicella sp.]
MAAAVQPPALPVPIEALRAYLRIEGSGEDALLAGLARSAGELCEAFTRLSLIVAEYEQAVPAQPAWTRLDRAPVRAILGVAVAGNGEPAPIAADDYAIDVDARGDGWVRVLRSDGVGEVLVRYQAGLAPDWNGIPEPLRQGIVRMASHLYAHRDGEDGAGPPAAVTALWLPYRRLRLS